MGLRDKIQLTSHSNSRSKCNKTQKLLAKQAIHEPTDQQWGCASLVDKLSSANEYTVREEDEAAVPLDVDIPLHPSLLTRDSYLRKSNLGHSNRKTKQTYCRSSVLPPLNATAKEENETEIDSKSQADSSNSSKLVRGSNPTSYNPWELFILLHAPPKSPLGFQLDTIQEEALFSVGGGLGLGVGVGAGLGEQSATHQFSYSETTENDCTALPHDYLIDKKSTKHRVVHSPPASYSRVMKEQGYLSQPLSPSEINQLVQRVDLQQYQQQPQQEQEQERDAVNGHKDYRLTFSAHQSGRVEAQSAPNSVKSVHSYTSNREHRCGAPTGRESRSDGRYSKLQHSEVDQSEEQESSGPTQAAATECLCSPERRPRPDKEVAQHSRGGMNGWAHPEEHGPQAIHDKYHSVLVVDEKNNSIITQQKYTPAEIEIPHAHQTYPTQPNNHVTSGNRQRKPSNGQSLPPLQTNGRKPPVPPPSQRSHYSQHPANSDISGHRVYDKRQSPYSNQPDDAWVVRRPSRHRPKDQLKLEGSLDMNTTFRTTIEHLAKQRIAASRMASGIREPVKKDHVTLMSKKMHMHKKLAKVPADNALAPFDSDSDFDECCDDWHEFYLKQQHLATAARPQPSHHQQQQQQPQQHQQPLEPVHEELNGITHIPKRRRNRPSTSLKPGGQGYYQTLSRESYKNFAISKDGHATRQDSRDTKLPQIDQQVNGAVNGYNKQADVEKYKQNGYHESLSKMADLDIRRENPDEGRGSRMERYGYEIDIVRDGRGTRQRKVEERIIDVEMPQPEVRHERQRPVRTKKEAAPRNDCCLGEGRQLREAAPPAHHQPAAKEQFSSFEEEWEDIHDPNPLNWTLSGKSYVKRKPIARNEDHIADDGIVYGSNKNLDAERDSRPVCDIDIMFGHLNHITPRDHIKEFQLLVGEEERDAASRAMEREQTITPIPKRRDLFRRKSSTITPARLVVSRTGSRQAIQRPGSSRASNRRPAPVGKQQASNSPYVAHVNHVRKNKNAESQPHLFQNNSSEYMDLTTTNQKVYAGVRSPEPQYKRCANKPAGKATPGRGRSKRNLFKESPDDPLIQSGPFDGHTTYREQFREDLLYHCPVHDLDTPRSEYVYKDEVLGHRIYMPHDRV